MNLIFAAAARTAHILRSSAGRLYEGRQNSRHSETPLSMPVTREFLALGGALVVSFSLAPTGSGQPRRKAERRKEPKKEPTLPGFKKPPMLDRGSASMRTALTVFTGKV